MLPHGCACMAFTLAVGSSVIRECIELNGTSYKGVKQTSSSGQSCLNWLNISNTYNLSIDLSADPGEWDHSYCRNPDASGKPWCFVAAEEKGIEKQDCVLETCQVQTKPPHVRPALRESAAVKSGLSRKPNPRPNKKKDPGAVGYTLAALLMLIIIVLGTGIAVIYFYKKSLKLKMQQEQRAHEQEMRRINLPQSAFCNTACDLTDEDRGQTDKERASENHTGTDETEDNTVEKDG